MKIRFYTDEQIRAAMPKRGGKYKQVLIQLMMERDYTYRRMLRYEVNVDIDKIIRRLR